MDSETIHWNEVDMSVFAPSVKKAIEHWGLDGLDIDAESEMPAGEFVPRFIKLAQVLTGALEGRTLTYTCFTGCCPGDPDYEILSKIKGQVSWVNLRAYWNKPAEYQSLYDEYTRVVGADKVTFGVKPGYEGEEESTLLETVKELAAWNLPKAAKAGMMMFGTNRDNPHFTQQPDWTYAQAIEENLGAG